MPELEPRSTAVTGGGGHAAYQGLMSASGDAEGPEKLLVVITGCTGGLGLELCRQYAKLGHQVIGCGRRQDKVAEVQAELGEPHRISAVDVADEAQVKRWAESIGDGLWPDLVINNAGMSRPMGTPWETDPEAFSMQMDVNIKGVFYVFRHFVPVMLSDPRSGTWTPNPEAKSFPDWKYGAFEANPGGARVKRIVNISSGAGHTAGALFTGYIASKWAVEGMSKSMATDFIKAGLHHFVCVPVAPGFVKSEMNQHPGAFETSEWGPVAAEMFLSLTPGQTGASLSVPGFYPPGYTDKWILPDGSPLPDKVPEMKDMTKDRMPPNAARGS